MTMTKHDVLSHFRILEDREPDRPLFTFVDERGRDEQTIRARVLANAAEGIAEALREWGFRPGDRAVLVYAPGADFVRALLGCLIAGVVPVPVYPPDPLQSNRLAAFNSIVADCGARAILTNTAYERARTLGAVTGFFDRSRPRWPKTRWYRTDRCPTSALQVTDWHAPADAGAPLLLQYTSGSTTSPRGVIITHENLGYEVSANARDLGLGDGTRGVFWLPQYHDFGLISVILSTAAGNSHTYMISPLTFLQQPSVWFDVMSRVRATHSAAPNFAFDLAVRKTSPEERARWDLRSVRVLMSAAEPIRKSTVDTFFDAFSPSGLRRESFYPAYGLAEHTVSVSMGGKSVLSLDKEALEKGVVEVVNAGNGGERAHVTYLGCGKITKPGAVVRIIDPETRRPRSPHEIGEIWVYSATKAKGYWGLERETEETFRAKVWGEDDSIEYLRTGDLGFFHDEELFVVGRIKDLVIVRGRKFHPQDLEASVRDCHELVRPGGLAAFTIDAGETRKEGERLVMFVEIKESKIDKIAPADREALCEAVRKRLYEDHQLGCHIVVVGPQGLVRKTTSGKVRRSACRQAWLAGEIRNGVFVSLAPGVAESEVGDRV